jgi:acetoin utilization deacetylase AcuC-like enzyme
MRVLVETHLAFADHNAGPGHPERPERLDAVLEGIGEADGKGATVNFPFPAGATGDVYLAAFDRVVDAATSDFGPTWVLVSAGFDAHHNCPITDLGLSTGDYADLMRRSAGLAPEGRYVAVLERGYDLDALRGGAEACVGALVGIDRRPEPPTSGGPGMDVVDAAADLRSS